MALHGQTRFNGELNAYNLFSASAGILAGGLHIL